MGLLKAAALLSFFTALGVPNCFSQTSGGDQSPNPYASPYYRPTPKTPEAAALGKFGDVPVSYNTGIPNISVPLYTLNSRSISVPISINYHAGGVKVNEIASSVGLGWSLEAGGMITHSPSGKRDNISPNPRGYPHTGNDYSIELTGSFPIPSTELQDYFFARSASKGEIDTDVDIFSGSFLGKSIKFVIDDSGVARTIPFQPLAIQLSPAEITITDEVGTKFFFQRTEETSPMTVTVAGPCGSGNPGNEMSGYNYLLNKIRTIDADSIMITYEQFGVGGAIEYTTESTFNVFLKNSFNGQHMQCTIGPNKFENTSCQQALRISPASRIKRITNSTGTQVDFKYSPANRLDLPGSSTLDSVIVSENGFIIRQFSLAYIYESSRLFLKSVLQTGSEPFTFDYYTDSEFPLPSRLSFSQDHWGYYNGALNTTLLPKVAFNDPMLGLINVGTANRNPNFRATVVGTLKRLTYPSGGYSSFEYEANVVHGPPLLSGRSACFVEETEIVAATPNYGGINAVDSVRTVTIQFTIPNYTLSNQDYSLKYDFFVTSVQTFENPPYIRIEQVQPNGSLTSLFTYGGGRSSTSGAWLSQLTPGNYEITTVGTFGSQVTASLIKRTKVCQEQTNQNRTAGGLRVKRITDSFQSSSSPSVRDFKYTLFGDSTKSSATYQGSLEYAHLLIFSGLYCDPNACGIFGGGECASGLVWTERYTCDYIAFSSSSKSISESNSGSPVNYSNVTVYTGIGGQFGRTDYTYFQKNDTINGISDWSFAPTTSYQFLRSLIIQESSHIRLASNTYRKILERSYKYNINHDFNSTYLCINNQFRAYCGSELNPNSPYRSLNESIIVGAQIKAELVELPTTSCHPGLAATFIPIYYRHISAWTPLVYTKEVSYDHLDTNRKVVKEYFYKYSNPKHAQVTEVKTVDDARDTLISWIKYPLDYSLSGAYTSWASEVKGISRLRSLHVVSLPVERVDGIKKSSTNTVVTSGTSNLFEPVTLANGYSFPALRRVNVLRLTTPVSFASFPFSAISGNTFSSSSFYGLVGEVMSRTPIGSWSEIRDRQKGTISRLWGYGERFPIAEAMNASISTIGYTSFENEDKGRFTYSGTKSSTEFYTGRFSYHLSSGSISLSISPAQKINVSFWAKGTGQVFVGTTSVSVSSASVWKQYNVEVVASSTILISTVASGLLIDELRVHPVTATMSTFAYEPESGVTSIGAPNSITSLFDYDRLGRLSAVRNSSNEIEKVIQYQYGTTFAAPSQFLMNSVPGQLNQYVGLPTLFAAQGLESSNSVPFIYDWNFGNGQVASGRSVTYAYPSTGNFAVTLRIRHPNFTTDLLQTGSINIESCPLISGSVTYSPSAPTTSDIITLNANASAGCGPFTYRWDWRATGSQTWNLISGATSSTCSISGGINNCSGFVVRCRVSNANQTFRDFEQPLEPTSTCVASTFQITTSPNPFYIADVVSCTISSTSQCPPLTYSWEGKPLNETTWSNLGSSQTISLQPPIASEGYQVRCTVSGSPEGPFTITKLLNPADGCPGCSY